MTGGVEREPETRPRTVYVAYQISIDLPEDATADDVIDHPDLTVPSRAEVFDWGFREEYGR